MWVPRAFARTGMLTEEGAGESLAGGNREESETQLALCVHSSATLCMARGCLPSLQATAGLSS